jgi:hypothetical protein
MNMIDKAYRSSCQSLLCPSWLLSTSLPLAFGSMFAILTGTQSVKVRSYGFARWLHYNKRNLLFARGSRRPCVP